MSEITATYEFEELIPVIDGHIVEGMMLYGTATLESAYPDEEPHEFYVKRIEINGGLRLRPDNKLTGQHTFNGQLFEAISKIIESPKTPHGQGAQRAFDEVLEGHREPDIMHLAKQMRERRRPLYA